jgi:ligand-binding sensor domain-containing protein/signal transduction histidine kinase
MCQWMVRAHTPKRRYSVLIKPAIESQKLLAGLMFGLLCLIASFQPASALDPARAITQYVHTVWRADDGLPQNSVMRILETKDGYLWVGTQNGIGRFDGVRFTVFDHNNTPSLRDNWIADLVEDREGTLWIATSHGGLTSYRDGRFAHVIGIGDRAAQTLATDPDGSLWVGGSGGLAHIVDGKVIKTYSATHGLAGDPVTRVVVDKDKSVWIATVGGLNRIAGGELLTYSTADGLPNNDVTDLHLAADGSLWIKTQNTELTRWSHGGFEPWKAEGVSGAAVRDLLQDRNGNLWIASGSEGLARIDGGQVSRFTTKEGLSSDEVVCLYEDRDGNLWAGTNEGGLDRFRDGNFTTFAKEEGLAADRTHSVIEDSAGDIWVTTSAGLNQLHGNHVRVFTTADGLPSNDVLSIGEDVAKNLWIGTLNSGVVRMAQGHVVQTLSPREGLPAYFSTGILEDSAHQLWLSTRGGGLARYADGRVSVFSKADGLLTNSLFALAEGQKGMIWIGTSDGLNSIQDGRIRSYATGNALSNAWIVTLLFDSRNILWIGTVERGLFRFENGRFTQYTTREGLPDNTIGNILEDASANLWIGSDKGISRLSRRDLDAVAAGTGTTVQTLVFGKADGMKTGDLNTGTQPTGWRGRDGRLWFPTTRGVVVVDPAHLSFDDRSLSARVEEMVADEMPVDLNARVRLAPGTRRLEIRYTAPNLSSPERTQFRYRMEGFDEQWVPGGNQRIAHYTNLSPGHYTFHVSARVGAGRWSAEDGTLDFDLIPQFYQTWWFRLLCGFAAIAFLWNLYRSRVNWLHARTAVLEERQRMAGEIHDNLAQGLSGIVFQAEAALLRMEDTPDEIRNHVASARDLARSSLKEARSSVWNLSPTGLDKISLLESVSRVIQQIAGGRADNIKVQSSGTPWAMQPHAENHVVRITQEAVSNALEHGKAHTIAITLAYAVDALEVEVIDDGVGFVPHASEEPGRGFGLKNMRHRSAQIGARIDITSETGRGTRVLLHVPRGNAFARLWRRLRARTGRRIDP